MRPDDVAVSWLPLYHDMGLIGSWLGALYFGIPIAILSPLAFLARPARWLQAIHAHRATISAAPNFGFDLCARRITDEEMRGPRSVLVAARAQRLGAGESGDHRALHRPLRPVWIPAPRDVPGLRPRRGLGGAHHPSARGGAADRHGRAGAVPAAPAARCPPPPTSPSPCASSRAVRRCRGTRYGWSIVRGGRSASAWKGGSNSGAPRSPRATGGTRPRRGRRGGTAGWIRATWATRPTASCSSPAGRRTSSRRPAAISIRRRSRRSWERLPGIRKGCVAAFGVHDPSVGTERLVVVAETRAREPAERERCGRR